MNNKKYSINDLSLYLKEKYNAKFYKNLNEAKKSENLVPKELYEDISVCTECLIKSSDNYACFAITTKYDSRELIVASYYDTQIINHIFVPDGLDNAQAIYKFMPFYCQLNKYSKEDFFTDVDKTLKGDRNINCKKFKLLMQELYNAEVVTDLTHYQKKLSMLGTIYETIANKKQSQCENLIYKISGEEYCIPDEEGYVLVIPYFSNDKLISVIYTSSFKYSKYLGSLADVDESIKLLL